jgi:putative Holliday junction resolvase
MRILGIDLGSKRIGLSLSDETETLASGFGTYQRKRLPQDLDYFRALVEDENISLIVLGLPFNMNGTLGPKADESLQFKAELEKTTKIPVELFDERLTSVEAERVLIEANLSRKRRKEILDQQAAILILQGFLDQRRFQNNQAGNAPENTL